MASSSTMDAVYEAPTSSRLLAKYQRVFALALLGVLVLLLMMVSGVVIRQQSRMLEDTFIRRGVATLEHLAALSQEPLATGKTADLSQVVQIAKLTDDDIEAIAILNAHGDIVAQTGRDILLPLDRSRVSSVVSARDYLRGMTRTFLGPVRSKTGGPLGVSYVRMSQRRIARLALEVAAKLDAAILGVFVIVGWMLNASLKNVQRLVAQEQKLQAQLVRSEKLATLGQLASSMAHELRNPLGAIKNAMYYIRDALKGSSLLQTDPSLPEFIDVADTEIKAATRIITDLLDYARVVKLNVKPTDVNSTLAYVKSTLPIPPDIKVTETYSPEVPPAMVDPDRMRQVFVNLATNAIQAMPKGGELQIRTRTEKDPAHAQTWIAIDFQDTGEGMTPETLAKIFEPLFSTKNNGTGLGLPISQSIVQAHGGQILVQSQAGKGSTFTVRVSQESRIHDR